MSYTYTETDRSGQLIDMVSAPLVEHVGKMPVSKTGDPGSTPGGGAKS